jgi:hypothetical protein
MKPRVSPRTRGEWPDEQHQPAKRVAAMTQQALSRLPGESAEIGTSPPPARQREELIGGGNDDIAKRLSGFPDGHLRGGSDTERIPQRRRREASEPRGDATSSQQLGSNRQRSRSESKA